MSRNNAKFLHLSDRQLRMHIDFLKRTNWEENKQELAEAEEELDLRINRS